MKIRNSMITTTFEIPGYEIKENIGIVKGISVRSTGWFGALRAGFQSMRQGNVAAFTQLCEAARKEALELLIQEGERYGANAIVSLRYDTNELAGIAEVFAYGTAVIVQKK